jgi:hypothetical protein
MLCDDGDTLLVSVLAYPGVFLGFLINVVQDPTPD